jgi:hypothetical protein
MSMQEPGTADKILRSTALTPSLYILILLCFFLPFCRFRCGTIPLAKIKGMDMAMGSRIDLAPGMAQNLRDFERSTRASEEKESESAFNYKDFKQKLPVNYWLLAAVVCSILGIIFSLFYFPRRHLILMIMSAGILGGLAAFIFTRNQYLLNMLNLKDLPPQLAGGFMSIEVMHLEPVIGYWIVIGITAVTAAVCFRQYKIHQREAEDEQAIELFMGEPPEQKQDEGSVTGDKL